MNERCQICVDPQCDGRYDCDCSTCDKADICYRVLRPTIRITTVCTQSCSHCCFECSPKKSDMMTVEQARKTKRFIDANGIRRLNLMGGEFFCNPDWYEILSILVEGIDAGRLVTNSDWAGREKVAEEVVRFGKENPHVKFALSFDRWHTNRHVEDAYNLLGLEDIDFKVAVAEEGEDETIVPVGRSRFEYNFYSSLATYCSKPDRRYSFLIDEIGKVYKCGFGMWDYANIEEYLEGGFAARFKEFNTKFHGIWISSCTACRRAYTKSL